MCCLCTNISDVVLVIIVKECQKCKTMLRIHFLSSTALYFPVITIVARPFHGRQVILMNLHYKKEL